MIEKRPHQAQTRTDFLLLTSGMTEVCSNISCPVPQCALVVEGIRPVKARR